MKKRNVIISLITVTFSAVLINKIYNRRNRDNLVILCKDKELPKMLQKKSSLTQREEETMTPEGSRFSNFSN